MHNFIDEMCFQTVDHFYAIFNLIISVSTRLLVVVYISHQINTVTKHFAMKIHNNNIDICTHTAIRIRCAQNN